MSDAREARDRLADLMPLGYTERDPYRNVFEAADAILRSDWLVDHDAEIWAAGVGAGIRQAIEAVETVPITMSRQLILSILDQMEKHD